MTKEIWVVYELAGFLGVYSPVRYYYSAAEAEKDVTYGGYETGLPNLPRRKMERIKMLEKYQPDPNSVWKSA